MLTKDHEYTDHLLALGSFTPRTLSILAIRFPVGTDFPASQAFTYDFWTHIWWANCYWVHPLAFLACWMAILRSWGIVGAKLDIIITLVIMVFIVHDLSDIFGIEIIVSVLMFPFFYSYDLLSRFFSFTNSFLSLGTMLEWTGEDCIALFLHCFKFSF